MAYGNQWAALAAAGKLNPIQKQIWTAHGWPVGPTLPATPAAPAAMAPVTGPQEMALGGFSGPRPSLGQSVNPALINARAMRRPGAYRQS